MKMEPVKVRYTPESLRPDALARPATLKLDPAIVQKIKEKVPIFNGMSAERLLRTLAMAEHHPVPAGSVVFNEGDMGDSFYVVIAGEVVVEKSGGARAVELARLGAGSCFGEMGLVGNRLRSATVRALDDVVTLCFHRKHVDAHIETGFLIYRNIARILANRLDDSSEMLAHLVRRKSER